jgi:hypothetical protein
LKRQDLQKNVLKRQGRLEALTVAFFSGKLCPT